MTTKLTPAGEAMEDFNDTFFVSAKSSNTMRQALEILDLIQRGDAKVLRRAPTSEMKKHAVGICIGFSGEFSEINDYLDADKAVEIWEVMFDAAPTPQQKPPQPKRKRRECEKA